MEIEDTLDFLRGGWRVRRAFDDHMSGAHARFEGLATLAEPSAAHRLPADLRVAYAEAGELHVGDHRGPASRRLECVRLDGGSAMLYFADGMPYVDLDLRRGAWQVSHLCVDDRYEIETLVRSPDLVEERWRVRGPDTSYDAMTTLIRLGDESGLMRCVTEP